MVIPQRRKAGGGDDSPFFLKNLFLVRFYIPRAFGSLPIRGKKGGVKLRVRIAV